MAEVSSASILRISDEKILQLIDLYRNEECLWNTNLATYRNREMRSLATEKIATILDLPNFTAKHVVMKFKNIRNSYSQELKKISQSLSSGANADNVYTPKVFWYSKVNSFLRPHLQRSRERPNEEALIYQLDESTEWVQVSNANPDTSVVEIYSESDEESSNNSCRKRKRFDHFTGTTSELTEQSLHSSRSLAQTLKDIQSHLHVLTSHNDDYHDTFGKHVASLLRSLPPQKALALQSKIMGLITSSGMEDDDEPSNIAECQSSQDDIIVMKYDRDDDSE